MIFGFAVLGAVVALIPGASFLLIPMEVFLLYKVATRYNAFEFSNFLGWAVALVGVSTALKGLASLLHVIPVVGQITNSIIAFSFIMLIGNLAEKHYSTR
jgi:hypothetical protein